MSWTEVSSFSLSSPLQYKRCGTFGSRGSTNRCCGTRVKTGWQCGLTSTENNVQKQVPSNVYHLIHDFKPDQSAKWALEKKKSYMFK